MSRIFGYLPRFPVKRLLVMGMESDIREGRYSSAVKLVRASPGILPSPDAWCECAASDSPVLALQAPGFCRHIFVMLLSEESEERRPPGCASSELRHCQHELLPCNG